MTTSFSATKERRVATKLWSILAKCGSNNVNLFNSGHGTKDLTCIFIIIGEIFNQIFKTRNVKILSQ